MTSLIRAHIVLLFAFAIPCSIGFGQDEVEDGITLRDGITLKTETIIGEASGEETLSRLVDKSTISNLEFLNSGDAPTSVEQLKAMQDHVAKLYERVEPAVVNIQSGMGQGSGVVVTSDGYVLTAAHVISVPNRSATITFPDGTKAKAQTLGLFRSLDAGLLKIYRMEEVEEEDSEEENSEEENSEEKNSEEKNSEEKNSEEKNSEEESDKGDSGGENSDEEEPEADEELKKKKRNRFEVQEDLPSFNYLDIGDSATLKLGQWVIAVGHPGGLDSDRGIVLRVGRINEIEAEQDDAYVRTDCTLVGGDSGGPLIGMDGSVIGIHSRIGSRLKQNFHVPSNDFIDNWTSLLDPVVHDRDAFMTISFRGGTNVISSIPRNSLAKRSGLKVSDRIIRIGEKQVYDKLQFDDAISELKPFQVVEFEVQRKGKNQVIDVTIGEKPRSLGFR